MGKTDWEGAEGASRGKGCSPCLAPGAAAQVCVCRLKPRSRTLKVCAFKEKEGHLTLAHPTAALGLCLERAWWLLLRVGWALP